MTIMFRPGTPGFSDLNREQREPDRRDDWQACGRVLAFMLTGLDPAAVVHGRPRELAPRLAELTGLRDTKLIELLARTLADEPSGELAANTRPRRCSRRRRTSRYWPKGWRC